MHGIADDRALGRGGAEAIANRVYANRLGNADEVSGDGWGYRGSGTSGSPAGPTTGKSATPCTWISRHPELGREPAAAARVAFAFWDARACCPLADRGDVEGVTEKINGPAKLGLAERRAAALRALGIWKE